MADDNGDQSRVSSSEGLPLLWAIIGFVVGGVLAFKVLSAMGVWGKPLSIVEGLICVVLFLGPFAAIMIISEHLWDDVKAGKSTNATYWTTMVGISVAALALVGVTSIDDLIGLAK
ncbi:hypothetical protein ACFV3E_41830 [Streptomyces sp. NPDC059718]